MPLKWASTLQLADSCGLTVFTLPRRRQSVQETQNESDLAVGKWDFEKFRGFSHHPIPPPTHHPAWGSGKTEGGTKQAWERKGVSCFLGWGFPLFGASLCDTSRWWEPGGEPRIRGTVAGHPSGAETYWSALALWGLSVASKRQLGKKAGQQ